jgi:hypothetical protein
VLDTDSDMWVRMRELYQNSNFCCCSRLVIIIPWVSVKYNDIVRRPMKLLAQFIGKPRRFRGRYAFAGCNRCARGSSLLELTEPACAILVE